MAARLMALAGIDDREAEDTEDQGGNPEDAWDEVDPDEFSYEELLALGEVVGTESRGLSADTIASLPSVSYKMGSGQNGSNESCVICRLDYEDGENLTVLSCKHSYHSECINNWLTINKAYDLHRKGRLVDLVDKSLSTKYDAKQVIIILNLAVKCTSISPTLRPTMSEVVSVLVGDKKIEEICPPAPNDNHIAQVDSSASIKVTSGASTTSNDIEGEDETKRISESIP